MPINKTYVKDILLNHADPTQYVTRGCLRPKVMHFRDSFGLIKPTVVDCGSCIRCADQAREQWCTRMILHTHSTPGCKPSIWKRAYFVTLTYGSYDLNQYSRHPFLNDWLDSCPSCDRDNKLGRYCWTPSLLIKAHVQKYIKRLRKSLPTGQIISYVYCGELGETYGRPHWHLIIWSNNDIATSLFSTAWGFNCRVTSSSDGSQIATIVKDKSSNYQFFSIGRVQVDDLFMNGSYNQEVSVDGKNRNTKYCFAYVAKYIHKDVTEFPEPSTKRYYKAFMDLPLVRSEYACIDGHFCDVRKYTYNGKEYELTFSQFKKLLAPCFVASTSYCIGKQYYLDNRERFKEGNLKLPTFRMQTLHFPKFYSYLLSLDRNPVRFEKATLSGRTLVKADSQIVLEYFKQLLRDPYSISLSFDYPQVGITHDNYALNNPNWQQNFDMVVFKTPDSTLRGYLDVADYFANDFTIDDLTWRFECYSKYTRTYHLVASFQFREFCEFVIDTLQKEFDFSSSPQTRLELDCQVEVAKLFDSPECFTEKDKLQSWRLRKSKAYKANPSRTFLD